jgi:hypothetical protein
MPPFGAELWTQLTTLRSVMSGASWFSRAGKATLSSASCTCGHSPSLRDLDISGAAVTAAGIEGLHEIGTLQCNLHDPA